MEADTDDSLDIAGLHEMIAKMGMLVESALRRACVSLSTHDLQLARQIIADDSTRTALRKAIERSALIVVARNTPEEISIQALMAVPGIAGSLARIGDHAGHVARTVGTIPHPILSNILPRIENIVSVSRELVREASHAYMDTDSAYERRVAERETLLAAGHRELHKGIVIMMKDNPDWSAYGVELLILNQSLERLSDHVSCLCAGVASVGPDDPMEHASTGA